MSIDPILDRRTLRLTYHLIQGSNGSSGVAAYYVTSPVKEDEMGREGRQQDRLSSAKTISVYLLLSNRSMHSLFISRQRKYLAYTTISWIRQSDKVKKGVVWSNDQRLEFDDMTKFPHSLEELVASAQDAGFAHLVIFRQNITKKDRCAKAEERNHLDSIGESLDNESIAQ